MRLWPPWSRRRDAALGGAVAKGEPSPQTSARSQAAALLRGLLPREEIVDRFDASYLDDLPDLLREIHGLTPTGAGDPDARRRFDALCRLAQHSPGAPWGDLPAALRRLGLSDEEFGPVRGDARNKKKYRYVKVPSWREAEGVVVGSSGDAVDRINQVQAEYSLQSGGKDDYEFPALARDTTGDPWTPLMQRLIQDGTVRPDEPVLSIGPRWAGEIRYFRRVVGFVNAIGLDLFSREPELVKVGDMHAMPFPDSHFGLVYQRNTFNKAYDVRRAIRDCVRVLRPGGVLISDDCLAYTEGVSELARTNMRHNRWMLRFLEPHVERVLYDRESPSGADWMERVGQLAVQIRR